eukprot:679680-Pyramimonas_sp.AAC.1
MWALSNAKWRPEAQERGQRCSGSTILNDRSAEMTAALQREHHVGRTRNVQIEETHRKRGRDIFRIRGEDGTPPDRVRGERRVAFILCKY